MYPYHNSPDPHAPPFNSPHRSVQPHPLNQNFRFPPSQPSPTTPQRSISQPQPQYPIESQGHSRRPSQLNPGASSFTYRPLEVSSPVDNGLGRLKRYHDDPSALGVNYGGDSEETYERRISPRKKALARAMEYTTPTHQSQPSEYGLRYPTSEPMNYDLPPHMIPQQAQPIVSTPTLHIQRDSQHYGNDRAILGVSRSATHSPSNQPQFGVTQNTNYAQTYHTPPPPLNRAWILDSSSRTSLSPLTQSHQGLPLTLSPLNTHLPHGRISPSHSIISAPYDSRYSPNSNSERRVISLSPNFGKSREDPISSPSPGSEKKYRGYRAKEGGPPKAVLGGPGGKTFDEMLALKTTQLSSPALSPEKDNNGLSTPARNPSGNSTTSETKWKGKPILIKLPPPKYSPPDSPPKPLPPKEPSSTSSDIDHETKEAEPGNGEEEPKKPRKEAFPWPKSKIRFSPPGVPLPLSPEQPGEETLERPGMDSTDDLDDIREGVWNGKEVLVSVPDEDCWERLRPPTPSDHEMQDDAMEETEAEVSAVLQPHSPMTSEEDAEDSKSVNAVENTTAVVHEGIIGEDEVEDIPWDEYPMSPTKSTVPTKENVKSDFKDANTQLGVANSQSDSGIDQSEPFKLVSHPSLPPRPITRDDPPPSYTPTSDFSSPTKRSFSGRSLGNSDFLKRQLGGVLKDPEDDHKGRDSASTHTREGSKASIRSWKQVDEVDNHEHQEQTASVILGLDSPSKGKSRMRGWIDDDDEMEDDYIQEREAVSSPARLGMASNPDIAPKDLKVEATVQEKEIAIPLRSTVSSENEPAIAVSSGSKMRAWSDDGEDMVWEEQAGTDPGSSPARLQELTVSDPFNIPQAAEVTKSVDSPNQTPGECGIDTIYPGHTTSDLRAWTPSPEPSRLRGWGLAEDIVEEKQESKSTPARNGTHTRTKSEAKEVAKWKNDKFDTLEEFVEVPLTATEVSKSRPWKEGPAGSKLRAWGEEVTAVEEEEETKPEKKEKRAREEESEGNEMSIGDSKMRAWSEIISTGVLLQQDGVKWTKNAIQDEKSSTDFARIMEERPVELADLRAQAMKSKSCKSPAKGKGKRKSSLEQSLVKQEIPQNLGNPGHGESSMAAESEEKLEDVLPSSPQAKRLRPTAQAWKPPQAPSYGSLGISSKGSKPPNTPPKLTAQATPFVPRATSFDFTVPRGLHNINAPAFKPRSTSFTFTPTHQPILPDAPPFNPAYTPFNVPPPANGPMYIKRQSFITPNSTPFNHPPRTTASHRNHDSITSIGSTGTSLRPTAPNFVPPLSVLKSGKETTDNDLRARSTSLASNNEELKLRPTAHAFVPPSRSTIKAVLRPTATAFTLPTDATSSDMISPTKSAKGSQGFSEIEIGDTSSSTIMVTSPPVTENPSSFSAASIQGQADNGESLYGSQELFRPPSSDEPILSPAEIRFEQNRPDSVDSGLQVAQPGRGRADTVAFGSHTPIGRGSEISHDDDISQDPDDGQIENSVVDLEGLFFDTPALTSSDMAESGLIGIREASPRLDAGRMENRESDNEQMTEQSQSRSSSSERLPRDQRPIVKREEENSHHPFDTPSLPLIEPVIPLEQIIIHPSHPISLPLTPRPNVEEEPDAPVSAHTQPSGMGSFGSAAQSPRYTHTARPSLTRPLPPIPQLTPQKAGLSGAPLEFASPAKMEEYSTPPQSTGDTFASAAYMTADGSPLIPTRTFEYGDDHTPPRKVRRPLPDIPTWREPIPSITPTPSTQNYVDPVEVLEDYQDQDDNDDDGGEEDHLVYPRVEIKSERRERGFDRSAAPSPELLSIRNEISEGVQPSPDPLVVNTKFREWTFPVSGEPDESGHKAKPSIIRRHTMPPEDQIEELDSPPITGEGSKMGIASTFAHRVEELRAHLRVNEEISRRTSVEFPMREQKRTLGVVNVDHNLDDTPPSTSTPEGNMLGGRVVHDQKLDEVLELVRARSAVDDSTRMDIEILKGDILTAVQDIVTQSQSSIAQPNLLGPVTSILEEHSRLLTKLQHMVNATPAQTLPVEGEEEQARSNDLFAAILTGQHSILEKFDEVASSQLSGSSTISQAIEALQFAQTAADGRSQDQDELRSTIVSLREEMEVKQIRLSESKAENDVLHPRLKDTRQDRDDIRERFESMNNKTEEMSLKQHKLEGELDGVIARALAAELERDALAKSLNERRDAEDGLMSQLKEYQEQLEKERENFESSSSEKEREITAMQSTIHTQISQIHQQNETIALLENSVKIKEEERQAEKDKLAKESTINELSQNTTTFQEELINRLNKLDENMFESMGSRVKEYESVLDRNRILQGEVDSLRERVEASADRFAKLQLSTSNALSANVVAQQALSDKLAEEIKRREKVESEMEKMRKELDRVKEEKLNWNITAGGRQAMARMQEVRLQALTQENVYWRQFALEHDRRRFKAYMGTKPFKNDDGTEMGVNGNKEEVSGGNGVISKTDDKGGTWYVEAQ